MPATASHTEASRADALRSAPAAVSVEGVSKVFRLPHQQYQTLKERALHPFKSFTYDELHALRDVSVDVREGEFFGIVGRNGSGKSTLLKCLAGIYEVSGGTIGVRGRLSPFIELGVGFNPDLTARDNVTINAIMLGLTRREARRRFDEIIAFAELEDFLELKLKNYSSGMAVRLAFSVAVQVDADVLLVDEVLAVGDASFQEKCYEQFRRLKEQRRTVLFVTHDMALVERFCDRAMLLSHGEEQITGDPAEVAERYLKLNFDSAEEGPLPGEGPPGPAQVTRGWWEDSEGRRLHRLDQGQACRACAEVVLREGGEGASASIRVTNDAGDTVFAARPQSLRGSGQPSSEERLVARVGFDFWLAPGRYSMEVVLSSPGGGEEWDHRGGLAPLTVQGSSGGGLAELPHESWVEPA